MSFLRTAAATRKGRALPDAARSGYIMIRVINRGSFRSLVRRKRATHFAGAADEDTYPLNEASYYFADYSLL
ncbi:MAG: hypothetical protein M3384_12085 [Acidobacteriota bacterium]|nr:hypothetical protein [Acidobacteriota bacterium]